MCQGASEDVDTVLVAEVEISAQSSRHSESNADFIRNKDHCYQNTRAELKADKIQSLRLI